MDAPAYSATPTGAEPAAVAYPKLDPAPAHEGEGEGAAPASAAAFSPVKSPKGDAATSQAAYVAPVSRNTPTSSASAAATEGSTGSGVALPPQVAALVNHVREGAAASAVPLVRSRAARLVSWQDPLVTGGVVVAALVGYIAHAWLAFTLPSLAVTLLVWGLLATGLLHAAAPYAPAAADIAARARVPLDEGAVDHLFQAGAVTVRTAVGMVNGWLTWGNPSRSLHALAWAWMATRFSFLLTPGWAVFGLLVAVAALPAYLLNVRAADAVLTGTVVPRAGDAARQVGDLVTRVKAQAAANGPAVLGACAAVPLLLVYLTWDSVALSTWATLFALAPVAYDCLTAAAGLASSGAGKRE